MNFFTNTVLLTSLLLMLGCGPAVNSNIVFISSYNPPFVLYAAQYAGAHERHDRTRLRELMGVDPVRTEWCAAFLNSILNHHGIPGSETVSDHPLMARSFLEWGQSVDTPQRGDIMVFRRGNNGWEGHVAIYIDTIEKNGRTYYRILGGNQNNEVNVSDYPASLLIDIRRINNPWRRAPRVTLALL